MSVNHAYLIKGWLLDKDPPKAVSEAMEAVIKALQQQEPVVHSGEPLDVKIALLAAAPEPEAQQPEAPKPPRKCAWSPEQRKAASDRMKARQANGELLRHGKRKPEMGEARPSPQGEAADGMTT